ncbi:MAG: fibronectin type III domain-containing protein [Deltaproteobacteria bacterium]|nr:fibronectin type III domain-containing protein [Deltaproteobacteria bacterium]
MQNHTYVSSHSLRFLRKGFPRFLSLLCLTLTLVSSFAPPTYAQHVTLEWDANTEPDLAGYNVYYKTGSSGPPYNGTGATEGNSPIDVGNVTQFTLTGLPDGVTHYFVVTAYNTGDVESDYSNEVSTSGGVTLAITSPQQGFSVNDTNYTSYTVSGTAGALASIEIFASATSLGTTTALANGTWTIDVDFTPCAEGSTDLTAESNGSTSDAVTGIYDKTPPNAPTVSGTTPTNDTTPTWSWSPGGGGTGTFRYKLDDSNLSSGATQTGSTSYTPGPALSESSHTLYVQERDGAGNWSSSRSHTIEIDTTPPSAPIITTDGGSGPGNDYTTNNASLVLEGTCAADTVTIYVNGTFTDVTYTAGETSWSYTATLLSGGNTFNVTARDAAGNLSNADSITVTYSALYGRPIGGYSTDNVIPGAQITQSTNGDGAIFIHFKVKDPTSDLCTLHSFQYSVNGGNTWNAPTNGDTSGSLSAGWQNNTGSKYSSAPAFSSAQDHSFTFNTRHQDVTGLNEIDQSDVRVRFTINNETYNSIVPVTSENFRADNLNPTGTITYSDTNPSHVDVGTLTITATFSESLGPIPQIIIDRPNPMSTIGATPMSGSGSVWSYNLTIQRHNGSSTVDGVYLVTISNVSDLAGNTGQETSNFATDTRDTDDDGQRDYIDSDDDNDELPDTWEEQYGLDPLDTAGVNGKDGDFDNDTWSNYDEYIHSTNPADNTSFPSSSPPDIVETIPSHNAGINGDTTRVSNNTSFCVRIEDIDGIDTTDSGCVTFTINDGVNGPYTRDLGDNTVVRVVKLTTDDDTSVTKLWVAYDRVWDTFGSYHFDTTVSITVDAKNRRGASMTPATYDFKIETEEMHDYAHDPANLPDTGPVDPADPAFEGPYNAGIQVNGVDLEGAKIMYASNASMIPSLGPSDEIPPLKGTRGAPINLQPFTVFNTPVKLFIPYPNSKNVTNLAIYVYKDERWVRGCDNKGRVRPEGEGWMVPGSRVNHNEAGIPTIEIKVYHFSAVQAADDPGDPSFPSLKGAETGGGCFIDTAMPTSIFTTHK